MKRVPVKSLVYDDDLMWLDGEPFTGIAYALDANGNVNAEYEYRDGLKWGWSRTWYLPGKPFQERQLFMGTTHGKDREWYPNGQLKEEGDYELGFALRRKRWDEAGNVTEEYELKETDPRYQELEEYREIYKDDLDAEQADNSGNSA